MEMNRSRASVSIEEFSSNFTYIELILIGVVMTIICAVTFVGNALVLISFIVDKKLRTLSNYFLLSLAVSDIMIATFSMPLFTAYLLIGEWTLGPAVCDMWLAQDYTCSNASCLNLLMIAMDRYFSVTNPLRYRAKRTAKRVGIMISCVWIISFLLWPPWIYAWPYIEGKRTVPEDDCYIQFLETNTYVTIITTAIDYYIPVLIILVLYYRIWRATKKRNHYLSNMETGYQSESMCLQTRNSSIKRSEKKLTSKSFNAKLLNCNINPDNSKTDDKTEEGAVTSLLTKASDNGVGTTHDSKIDNQNEDHQRYADLRILDQNSTLAGRHVHVQPKMKSSVKQDKAARVLTVILFAFIITTTPYNVIVFVMNLDSSHSLVSHNVWNFFYYLFYINSTLNPLCYALANKSFRMTYWKILSCSWSPNPQVANITNSHSNKSSESKSNYFAKHPTSSV